MKLTDLVAAPDGLLGPQLFDDYCPNGLQVEGRGEVQTLVTGEVSVPTVHVARETGLHFFAAGRHATERYGVQAVGDHFAAQLGLTHHFVDIDNPACGLPASALGRPMEAGSVRGISVRTARLARAATAAGGSK